MPLPSYGPPYGSGTPTTSPAGGTALLDKTTGRATGSRYIDPVKRDYVMDTNGRMLGMSDVRQLVHIAVSTEQGSSAIRALGQKLKSIQVISSNFQTQVETILRGCVQHLVDLNLVKVLDVSVQKIGPSSVAATMRWRDLTLGLDAPDQETVV